MTTEEDLKKDFRYELIKLFWNGEKIALPEEIDNIIKEIKEEGQNSQKEKDFKLIQNLDVTPNDDQFYTIPSVKITEELIGTKIKEMK